MKRSNGCGKVRPVSKPGNSKRRIKILSDLGNYPMRDGPGVYPVDRTVSIAALNDNDWSKGGYRLRSKVEGVRWWGVSASEEAHHKLVGRRAMEPPLEVGREEFSDGGDVTWLQRFIEGENQRFVVGFLQSCWVSQFGVDVAIGKVSEGNSCWVDGLRRRWIGEVYVVGNVGSLYREKGRVFWGIWCGQRLNVWRFGVLVIE